MGYRDECCYSTNGVWCWWSSLTEEGLIKADDAGVAERGQEADLIESTDHLLIIERAHIYFLEGVCLLVSVPGHLDIR